ncbi:hypothetical protein [Nonomuraea sp. JJY05]|uniref:hypothetical protein n=1 Tax=Nonomuraea sp. JJY05 TaxID=3350255 RepID=UPI00373F3038
MLIEILRQPRPAKWSRGAGHAGKAVCDHGGVGLRSGGTLCRAALMFEQTEEFNGTIANAAPTPTRRCARACSTVIS